MEKEAPNLAPTVGGLISETSPAGTWPNTLKSISSLTRPLAFTAREFIAGLAEALVMTGEIMMILGKTYSGSFCLFTAGSVRE